MELTQEPSIHRFEMIEDWRQSVVAQADLRVSLRTLETCECWSLSDGSLRHDSGRFFQVVGAVWQDESPQYCALIEQREIGTLASVIRHRNGAVELLVQAKVEPGNIDGVQFAPTAQATASNADCVHGGRLPPFSDYFARRKGRLIADSLQSEQGQKFLGKRNRNLMVCDDTLETTGPIHRWIPFRLFRALLLEDFRVNTDLRSVLCVTDWNFLSGGVPFSDPESLSVEFRDSFLSLQRAEYLQAVLRCLDRARQTAPTVTSLPVTSLPDWTFRTDHELVLASPKSAIKMIHVEVETREISVWDQPIFKTKSPADRRS